ncbi:MAG TPA: multicopper oxidase domain-containing protein [Chloroflexia bacterium]|nr:multicopper oxidase domain-containing protein [Chloroflexia bacterium]
MNVRATSISINPIMHALVLAYGGAALLQWVHAALLGGAMSYGEVDANWLRDGTLALPFVLAVVLYAGRRMFAGADNGGATLALLYAGVMGAGFLLGQSFPAGGHAQHEADVSTFSILQHALVIVVVAGAYTMFVEGLLKGLGGNLDATMSRLRVPRKLAPVVWSLAALLVVMPALLFTGGGRAAAQTTFPDQAIHPKGTLLLVARAMPDGSLAYVAPEFGANGVRPTIEMTEGETLDITLKNELSGDVSLHVHGVHYKPESDGTRHSNSIVKPGQQRVYQWKAGAGTSGYWHYHDHVMGDDEGSTGILGGLYGGLVVRRAGDPKPSKTFVIVGHDKTLNGRIYPDTPAYTAREGELVEWLVISHGNRVHTFHLHAHRWITPNRPTDSSPSNAANAGSGREDNHILAPGDSFGFMVIAGEGVGPGMWMYHCHFQDHASAMKGFFKVLPAGGSAQVETSRTFQETGKTVSGRFLEYWTQNGGLAQQGFPLSDEFEEKNDLDGKTYKVQYFERSVFEYHPENKPPYDVLLSQLGTFRYKEKYPAGR